MKQSSPDYQTISMLIEPSKAGDSQAQADLLAQLQDYVLLMAERHLEPSLRQKAGYSDIAQEAMTRVVENFDQFQGNTGAEFRGWLKTIVVNEINRLRRRFLSAKRNLTRERDVHPDKQLGHSRVAVDFNLTPSTEAIEREQIERFRAVMQLLPEDYQTVLRLRSLESLPFKEVANRMGKTHDAVTKLWYRAALKLEEKLQGLDFEV